MWFVIQVQTGREDITVQTIERYMGPDIVNECFTPKYATQIKVAGTWRPCERPLFPGYVIADTDDVEPLRNTMWRIPEFARVLRTGEQFLPLEEEECVLIKALTTRDRRTVEMSTGFMDGDRVVVVDGPLVGREGWISGVNRHKSLAFLKIEMFGRTLSIRVGLGILSRKQGDGEKPSHSPRHRARTIVRA